MSLKVQITDDMKSAMKAGDKDRLKVVRLIMAAIKQVEVDTRKELDDAAVLSVLDKMVKQRRDSLTQYRDAGRDDLADREASEIDVIQTFLPAQLSDEELAAMIDAAIAGAGTSGMQAMGAVMGQLKPQLAGRADMGAVSQMVKARLTA